MKQKVKKTFYNGRKIYVEGQMYETESFDEQLVGEYFEEVEKPKRSTSTKKKVRKPKPESKKTETKKEQKKDNSPAKVDPDVESVEAPAKADEEAEISTKDAK